MFNLRNLGVVHLCVGIFFLLLCLTCWAWQAVNQGSSAVDYYPVYGIALMASLVYACVGACTLLGKHKEYPRLFVMAPTLGCVLMTCLSLCSIYATHTAYALGSVLACHHGCPSGYRPIAESTIWLWSAVFAFPFLSLAATCCCSAVGAYRGQYEESEDEDLIGASSGTGSEA
mmetsp:Transcript_16187/g.33734  ORF Transcript_16187/g.33734 Transcript_16187/m.33734 type:complete len:173 (-) Transcript_16187:152-670(-)